MLLFRGGGWERTDSEDGGIGELSGFYRRFCLFFLVFFFGPSFGI